MSMPVDLHDTGEDVHGEAIAEVADRTISHWLQESWASEPTRETAAFLSAGLIAALVRFAMRHGSPGTDPRARAAELLTTIQVSAAGFISQYLAGGGDADGRGRMQ